MSYVDPGAIKEHIDSNVAAFPGGGAANAAPWIKPYVWRHPSEIPRRRWLYGGHYIRDFLTATFAPGGSGKSALAVVEALAMATGRSLLGIDPIERCKVSYWNGEDPLEETERRVAAAILHFQIQPAELDGWFFWGSGRESKLIIAEQTRDGTTICKPDVDKVCGFILEHHIDVAIVDPFVSSHRVTENDNNAIGVVATEWGAIAGRTNSCAEMIHHTTKAAMGREVKVEDGRGGGALLFAARSARVLNTMTEDEAERAGVDFRRAYFRVDNGKANLAPPPDGSHWFKFESEFLGNGAGGQDQGDSVGVVTRWEWPEEAESSPRKKDSSKDRLVLKYRAKRILAAYWRLVDDGKTSAAPPALGVPTGKRAVTDIDLRNAAVRMNLVHESKPEAEDKTATAKWLTAVRQAWKVGTEELIDKGLLRFEDDYVWDISPRKGGMDD